MKLGLIYRFHCFNFDTDVLFFMQNIKKVLYSIKACLGYVFRLCFPHSHEFEIC